MEPGVSNLDVKKKEIAGTWPLDSFSCEGRSALWGIFDALSPEDRQLCVFFLQQNVVRTREEISLPDFLNRLKKQQRLDQETGKRITLLFTRVIGAREGISRQEIGFLRKLWDESQAEGEQRVGAPA